MKMKPILTYREYKDLKEIWKRSNSASRMLLCLPYYYLGNIETGLASFVEWFFKEVGTDDELTQHKEDCETRNADCKQRMRDGEITQREADSRLAEASWMTAISELQYCEYLDAVFAEKLREFADIRLVIAC
jgi:hypothetical protein